MRILQAALGSAALLLLSTGITYGEGSYRLQPGDVIEVSIMGLPDLKTRSMIDGQGALSVPLIPQVKVGGLTLDRARDLVATQLSQKIIQQRTVDGREATVAISPSTVLLLVAEYRPVYLNGDVTKPGEQAYRPGLTVQQAVALAGGYEIMRFRMNNPFIETADLRRDYQAKWVELADAEAVIWRLRSELHEKQASLEEVTTAPLPQRLLEELRTNARNQLSASQNRLKAELDFLQRSANTSSDTIEILRKRLIKEDESAANDHEEFAALQQYVDRGTLPIMRLAEVRRLSLLSETQTMQTSVSMSNVARERDEYIRRKDRIVEEHRIELLKLLNEQVVKRDAAQAALAAISEKIAYTGMIRSQLARGDGIGPTIYLTHSVADGGSREQVSETTQVMPGDTIDVRLHTETPDQLSMK